MKSLNYNLEKLGKEELEDLLEDLEKYNNDDYRRIYLEECCGGYGYSIDSHEPTSKEIGIHRACDWPYIKISHWKEIVAETLDYIIKGEEYKEVF